MLHAPPRFAYDLPGLPVHVRRFLGGPRGGVAQHLALRAGVVAAGLAPAFGPLVTGQPDEAARVVDAVAGGNLGEESELGDGPGVGAPEVGERIATQLAVQPSRHRRRSVRG